MSRHALAASISVLATLAACGGTSGPPASPVQVESLEGRDVDMIGTVVDIPDGQYLGERQDRTTASGEPLTIRWDERTQTFDRFSEDYRLSTEDLRAAGMPVLDGKDLEFTEGMFKPMRYRLGAEIFRLTILKRAEFEVRMSVRWRLYDTESNSWVLERETSGFARGAALGDRGVIPNVLLSAYESALGGLVADPAWPAKAS